MKGGNSMGEVGRREGEGEGRREKEGRKGRKGNKCYG